MQLNQMVEPQLSAQCVASSGTIKSQFSWTQYIHKCIGSVEVFCWFAANFFCRTFDLNWFFWIQLDLIGFSSVLLDLRSKLVWFNLIWLNLTRFGSILLDSNQFDVIRLDETFIGFSITTEFHLKVGGVNSGLKKSPSVMWYKSPFFPLPTDNLKSNGPRHWLACHFLRLLH